MRKPVLILALSAMMSMLALSACNTMEGMGEDIKAGGEKIDNTAEKHKNY